MGKRNLGIVSGVYENGAIRFRPLKLRRRLPLRNRTTLHFRLELPGTSTSEVLATFGLLRTSRKLARLVAESPDLSLLGS